MERCLPYMDELECLDLYMVGNERSIGLLEQVRKERLRRRFFRNAFVLCYLTWTYVLLGSTSFSRTEVFAGRLLGIGVER